MNIRAWSIYCLTSLFLLSISCLGAQNWADDFSAIDLHAGKSPKSLHENLPALTAYLCENTDRELEKVRAIYVWITTHIGYDWKAADQDKRINHFIRDILDRKVALCVGYAQLFQQMCQLAGIRSAVVHGYAKGTASALLPLEEPNHSWNAVMIKGEWYLLDVTWGSSTVNQKNEFVQISNDDYFLIRPERFIQTHLPGNPMWQLLNTPVPADDFLQPDTILSPVVPTDSGFAFRDSLETFYTLSIARRRVIDYERSYQFYPTTSNKKQLGHALIDYAGILSDSLENLSKEEERPQIIELNSDILRYCRRARALTPFYAWQEELLINALINQAVFKYNWQDELGEALETSDEEILSLLEEAQKILLEGEDSYFNRMARRQCEHYLAIVKSSTR